MDRRHYDPADAEAFPKDVARALRQSWVVASKHGDGPRAVTEIQAEAEAAGYAWQTVRTAKDAIGADAIKMGLGGQWGGGWSLPKARGCPRA